MAKQEIRVKNESEINWKKVEKDLGFFRLIIDLANKSNWRVVVSGGYGLDLLLGKITRNHDDLDVIIYGEEARDKAVTALYKLIKSEFIEPKITVKSELFFENVDVLSPGFGANMYYVQTAENPHTNIQRVRKLDGEVISNAEERFPSPVMGKLDDLVVEVQNPNTHLADIIYKRMTQPHKLSHEQDIANLELVTDPDKVETILALM